jgi:hypothetical protein
MITSKELESLGWNHIHTANAGSKLFTKVHRSNIIFINSENVNKPGYETITITKNLTVIWEGMPEDIQDLKRILVETGVDAEWLSEVRDNKLKDILNDNY